MPEETRALTEAGRQECSTCQGDGEIVTDWDVYLNPWPKAPGEAGKQACFACDGSGRRALARATGGT